MAELVTVTKTNGDEVVVTTARAQEMLDDGELTVPAAHDAVTPQDVFGDDYESSNTFSGT